MITENDVDTVCLSPGTFKKHRFARVELRKVGAHWDVFQYEVCKTSDL